MSTTTSYILERRHRYELIEVSILGFVYIVYILHQIQPATGSNMNRAIIVVAVNIASPPQWFVYNRE